MTSDGIPLIADAAWIILDNALRGGPSGLDEGTITWSKSTAVELERTVADVQNSPHFSSEFVTAMAASRREVSLLAVELTALALLPLTHSDRVHGALFDQLVVAVAGPALVVPPELLRGIGGLGFRSAELGDALPARLLYLISYVKTCGSCPDYDALVERGDDEYLGHEDLQSRCPGDLITETPWACAEFSESVDHRNTAMRYDFDHMLWPEFLAPPSIRLAAEEIRDKYADLLQGDSGNSVIGIQKDLYLLKQLVGSWDDLRGK